jgi:hypothetical protein
MPKKVLTIFKRHATGSQPSPERVLQVVDTHSPKAGGRFLRVELSPSIGFLLLVASAALTALESLLGSFMTNCSVILPVLDFTLSFAMTTLLFAMIYKYVPREKLAWGTSGSVQWSRHYYSRLESS